MIATVAVPFVEIPLTQGKVALVDEADRDLIAPYRWHAVERPNGLWYAQADALLGRRGGKLWMHRVVMGCTTGDGQLVDHREANNTLDNRRSNLRLATQHGNQGNRRKIRGSSQFKGVSFCKLTRKWRACIGQSGKVLNLGRYENEVDAAAAYDSAARAHFGEFARTNFP